MRRPIQLTKQRKLLEKRTNVNISIDKKLDCMANLFGQLVSIQQNKLLANKTPQMNPHPPVGSIECHLLCHIPKAHLIHFLVFTGLYRP